jgi:hypothetical protein
VIEQEDNVSTRRKEQHMGMECSSDSHGWDGCKCKVCGKVRDKGHDWSKDCEKCTRCGKPNKIGHNRSKDCEDVPAVARPEPNHTAGVDADASSVAKERNRRSTTKQRRQLSWKSRIPFVVNLVARWRRPYTAAASATCLAPRSSSWETTIPRR